jgi:FKBP-type peptidyl-prolyl cis-trans isomerase
MACPAHNGKVSEGWPGLSKQPLIVSPHLVYGETGMPGIVHPKAVLILELEILDVQAPTTTS